MGLPEKLSIENLCDQWPHLFKNCQDVFNLAKAGKLNLWCELYDVQVEGFQGHNSGYHKRFEIRLLPQDIADLARTDDALIKTIFLSGFGTEGYGSDVPNSYTVRVYKLNGIGALTLSRSDLFVRREDMEVLEGKNKQASPKGEKLFTKAAIARYLSKLSGFPCSESSVKGWMKNEGLPYQKELNRRVTAIPSELNSWWENRKAKKKTT